MSIAIRQRRASGWGKTTRSDFFHDMFPSPSFASWLAVTKATVLSRANPGMSPWDRSGQGQAISVTGFMCLAVGKKKGLRCRFRTQSEYDCVGPFYSSLKTDCHAVIPGSGYVCRSEAAMEGLKRPQLAVDVTTSALAQASVRHFPLPYGVSLSDEESPWSMSSTSHLPGCKNAEESASSQHCH